eukprot:g16174.t1
MVTEAGIQPESKEGLPLDPTVQLAMDWFGNANADVRENAVKLVAACYAHAGMRRIEKYLANIRQAQREIFDEEFDRVDAGDGLQLAQPSHRSAGSNRSTPKGTGRSELQSTVDDVGAHELFSVCFWELGTATKESSLGQLGTFFRATAMPKVKKQNLKKKAAKATADSRKPAGATGTSSGGLVTNKKFGQHLLRNPGIVDKILNAAELKPSDVAFEIAKPSPGCKRVIACEIDPRMAAEVRKRCSGTGRTNLEVRESDVLKEKWPIFDVCVANLPISSPFTFKLLAHRPAFRCAVLMFQKEFAERLIAQVGDSQYGRLAVNTSLFVKVSCVCKVGRMNFTPPPEVDSMVLELRGDNYTTWCALTGNRPDKRTMKEKVIEVLSTLKLAEKRAIKKLGRQRYG